MRRAMVAMSWSPENARLVADALDRTDDPGFLVDADELRRLADIATGVTPLEPVSPRGLPVTP